MENDKRLCETARCTGCFACMNACPKDAISVDTDSMGKTIPVIDETKCIHCGKCNRACPVEHKIELHDIQHCYAAKTKQRSDEEESASGGMAAGFYRYFLQQGGIVFGAAFDEEMTLCQMACETEADMLKFRGSKYVQSAVKLTYRQVKDALNQGRKVLYIGTPCQIAGLRGYLGKEEENLLLVDIVCHGAPPMQYLKEYEKKICQGQKADHATFRGKYDYQMRFYKGETLLYKRRRDEDEYFATFSAGDINRDNCYQCTYAQPKRTGDLTIGDFWGLNRETLKSGMEGRISVMMVNTAKGEYYLEQAKDTFVLEEREIAEGVQGNSQLHEPKPYSDSAKKFKQVYPKKGFIKAARATKAGRKAVLKRTLPGKVYARIRYLIRK